MSPEQLRGMTYEQAEQAAMAGRITETEHFAYLIGWRRSVARFSSLAASFDYRQEDAEEELAARIAAVEPALTLRPALERGMAAFEYLS